MHWELNVGEPIIPYIDDGFTLRHDYKSVGTARDKNSKAFLGKIKENPNDWCVIPLEMVWKSDGDVIAYVEYIESVVAKLSLDKQTYKKLESRGLPLSRIFVNENSNFNRRVYTLRNSEEELNLLADSIFNVVRSVKQNFVIRDNMNQLSDFRPDIISNYYDKNYYAMDEAIDGIYAYEYGSIIGGSGIFAPVSILRSFNRNYMEPANRFKLDTLASYRDKESSRPGWYIYVFMPLSEIGKYSSFKIEPKE